MSSDEAAVLATEAGHRLRAPTSTVIHSQDVKCFLCGFTLGQVVRSPEARVFRPAAGQTPPAGFQPARPRCFRCGGPCFLDEIETIVQYHDEPLEKPRRGRKPKPRPDVS